MYHSFMLFLAIVAEVVGTIFMRYSAHTHPLMGTIAMMVLITVSYFFLSKAIKQIPLGIAYAVWEGAGILLISIASYYLFDETISLAKFFAISLIIAGLLIINSDKETYHG